MTEPNPPEGQAERREARRASEGKGPAIPGTLDERSADDLTQDERERVTAFLNVSLQYAQASGIGDVRQDALYTGLRKLLPWTFADHPDYPLASENRRPDGKRSHLAIEWTYGFSIWPSETGDWERSLFDVFRLLGRMEMEFTQRDWAEFRASIERQGFTLREVERIPHHYPEPIR